MRNRTLIQSLILAFLMVSFGACQMEDAPTLVQEEVETVQSQIDAMPAEEVKNDRPFGLYYHQLLMALASNDPASFNDLIHPENGCYLIESPGAIPAITLITDVGMVMRKGTERGLLDWDNAFLSFSLTEESLPTIDCDSPDGFYSKEGTFVDDVNGLAEGQIWKYVGLDDKDKATIALLAGTITKTIVNTAGFTAYFSKIDDEWYITFFDIRVPCTA